MLKSVSVWYDGRETVSEVVVSSLNFFTEIEGFSIFELIFVNIFLTFVIAGNSIVIVIEFVEEPVESIVFVLNVKLFSLF